jgi:O-antigen ligase
MVEDRMENLVTDFGRIEEGDYVSSIGDRLKIWDKGLELAPAKPIFGHGPAVLSGDNVEGAGFSHFHNFLLNAMVRSGLVGVAAILALLVVPLWIVVRHRSDEISRFGVAMLVTLQAAFLLSGSVGIMLGHDILDALFIYGTIVASFLVLGENRDAGHRG